MNPDHSRYADWDSAYVLGALSPAERREYEEHLETCEACRRSVAELSPMPGLLARLSAGRAQALLEEPDGATSSPDPALLDAVRREGRRRRIRRTRTRIALAAAAAVVGAIVAEISTGTKGGIGRLILEYSRQATGDPAKVYTAMLGAALLGLAVAAFVSLLEYPLMRHRRRVEVNVI